MLKILTATLGAIYFLTLLFAPNPPSYNFFRYEDFLLLILLFISIVSTVKSESRKPISHFGFIFIFYYLTIFLIISSFMAQSLLLDKNTWQNSLLELARLAKYTVITIMLATIQNKKGRDVIRVTLIVSGIIMVIMQLSQFWGNESFNQAFSQFYGSGDHFEVAVTEDSRALGYFYAGGSLGNPNVTGAFLLIVLCIPLWQLLAVQKKTNSQGRRRATLFNTGIVILLLIGIVATRSRATIIGTAVVMASSIFMYHNSTRQTFKLAFAFIMVFSTIFLAWPLFSGGTTIYKEYEQGLQRGDSIDVKFKNLSSGLETMIENKAILGLGARYGMASTQGNQADFEYAYFLLWYGPIGLITYIAFWLSILLYVYRHKNRFDTWQMIVVIVLGLMVTNFSQTSFLVTRVFPIFLAVFFSQVNWENLPIVSRWNQRLFKTHVST